MDSRNMLKVGTILRGTYRIDRYLSSGGFGNTYVVTNINLGDVVAIKEFFMKGVSSRDSNNTTVTIINTDNLEPFEQQKNKFKKEAKRLHNIHNAHIVQVHDFFEENGTAYYTMDFIDGVSLYEKLKSQGHSFSESEVKDILYQVLDALGAVHKLGIFHLDLKPANIMMEKDGTVKLIDFGASKQQSIDGGATSSTGVSYTNGYAPFEQMEGNLESFGPWTDFYALGATLYNLLTGRKPPMPSDISVDESKDKHESLPMQNVGKAMHDLVIWMLQVNRNKRPQSVKEIYAYIKDNFGDGNAVNTADDEDDETLIDTPKKPINNDTPDKPKKKEDDEPVNSKDDSPFTKKKGSSNTTKIVAVAVVVMFIAFAVIFIPKLTSGSSDKVAKASDSTLVASSQGDSLNKPVKAKENDAKFSSSSSNSESDSKIKDKSDPSGKSSQSTSNKLTPSKNRDNFGTPSQSSRTGGTLDLGYGTWSGGISGGKPDGRGRLTFYSSHRVDRSSSVTANAGDYFVATYDHGSLISGKLYDSDGNPLKTIIP